MLVIEVFGLRAKPDQIQLYILPTHTPSVCPHLISSRVTQFCSISVRISLDGIVGQFVRLGQLSSSSTGFFLCVHFSLCGCFEIIMLMSNHKCELLVISPSYAYRVFIVISYKRAMQKKYLVG